MEAYPLYLNTVLISIYKLDYQLLYYLTVSINSPSQLCLLAYSSHRLEKHIVKRTPHPYPRLLDVKKVFILYFDSSNRKFITSVNKEYQLFSYYTPYIENNAIIGILKYCKLLHPCNQIENIGFLIKIFILKGECGLLEIKKASIEDAQIITDIKIKAFNKEIYAI